MNRYSIREVADLIYTEGLGYAIEGYLSADRIEDRELARHWKNAQESMREINRIVRGEEGDNE